MSKKKHLRRFSIVNPWIDFVVTVDESDAWATATTVARAMQEFWACADDGLCYGDAVENALTDAGIAYDIMYHDADDMTDEYEKAWEARLPKDCELI